MRVNRAGRPKDIKFKVPSRTGATVYRKDYKKKENKYQSEDVKHSMSVDCIKTNNFLGEEKIDIKLTDNTMYQSDFKFHPQRVKKTQKIKRKFDTLGDEDDNVPRFFETQNKFDFLNWAGKNSVPSMKPEYRPAITNVPLSGSSTYKSDF